jgi:hypothetical protein
MAELLFYPILILLLILQMVIVRQLPLFNGTVDLLLLWLASWGLQKQGKNVWVGAVFVILLMSFVSSQPWYVWTVTYLSVAIISRFMNRNFWQNPLIALIFVVFISSIIGLIAQMGALIFHDSAINIAQSIKYVVVPSVFLNLLFAIPVYIVVNDMAQWVYPIGKEE